jgi:ceramide glucosyltransferase
METVLVTLAFVLLLQSLAALAAALRFARHALRPPHRRASRHAPRVAVIIPCKGVEPDFEENIGAYLAQDYRHYELIFVTESENDPAYKTLGRTLGEYSRPAWLIAAGESAGQGQKVHNLCAALDALGAVNKRAEVLVFADADARPNDDWLRELVAALDEERVGAATGFRWYVPAGGWLWAGLLSAWNASALNLLGERSAFAWGGSMAIRRDQFERLKIRREWDGALSDDYALTQAVQAAGLRVRFAPGCLLLSEARTGFRSLLEFTTRQLAVTRVYAPRVWLLAASAQALYNVTFWGGLAFIAARLVGGHAAPTTLATLLAGSFWLGALAGGVRAFVAAQALPPEGRAQVRKHWWAYLLAGPFVSLLYFYNVCASALTRRVTWRGITYEMMSPHETVIRHRPPSPDRLGHPAEPAPRTSGAAAQSSSTPSN